MTTPQRNLVLVHTPTLQARSDFETIKAKLAERAPDIEVFVADNQARNSVTRKQAARRPSLIFSPIALRDFRPLRGKVYAGRALTKMEEYRRLTEAGQPVPETVMLGPDTRLDPQSWGPFTVLKPNVGRQGAGVRLVRTRDVVWRDPFSWPRNDPRFGCQMLAQKFVDTGAPITSHRVHTVFGRIVYSVSSVNDGPVVEYDPAGGERLDVPVAANHGERHLEMNFREDIFATAREAAAASPDLASLGLDLIQEKSTGRLYVIEMNSRGITWHISSNYGMDMQRKHGVDFAAQFGALDVIADALIDVTRREAE